MASAERYDAFGLLQRFRTDEAAAGEALTLFVDRPDYGFIWLAYVDGLACGCASVALGIDTETGGLVATVRDLFVLPERRRMGIGSALVLTLHGRLAQLAVTRIDVIATDATHRAFLEARGYALTAATFTLRP